MLGSVRFAALSAIAGAVLGIALTPFMASVWAYEPGVVWSSQGTWVERATGPTLESWGALSFGWGPFNPYGVYGKGFFLVYLLMVPMVRLVHSAHRDSGNAGRLELSSWRVMFVALLACSTLDFVSYWGYSVPGVVGEALWSLGFGMEAPTMIVLLVSTTLFGIAALRIRVLPAWASLLIAAIIPLTIAVLFFVTTYVPNAMVVPLAICWAVIGIWLLLRPRSALAMAVGGHPELGLTS